MSYFFSAIVFYLIILPISWLPFPLFYLLSDMFFVIIYYIIPYRRKIVLENLKGSFPEKSDKELKKISRKFYRHFCDVMLETLKVFTESQESIRRRVEAVNTELLHDYYTKGKSIILVNGHYANWEWPGMLIPSHSPHKGIAIYQTLSNKFFDKKIQATRRRFGMTLMTTKEVPRFFATHKNEACIYLFINDQSPADPSKGHWTSFLNRPTCMITGAERYAVKHNYPVVYSAVTRLKRGHYRVEYVSVSEFPQTEPAYFITEQSARINESLIRNAPAYWLWTHRRWKHKPEV